MCACSLQGTYAIKGVWLLQIDAQEELVGVLVQQVLHAGYRPLSIRKQVIERYAAHCQVVETLITEKCRQTR